IRSAMSDIPYRVRIETDRSRVLAAKLLEESLVHGVSIDDGTLHVETDDLSALGGRVPAVAHEVDARITTFQPEDASLESVFRYLVRKR
ncbi:MAG: ABC transporter ATP-binding protein, partial [Actinomycetota bacterium]|nr:ABC transporter ATP-binding protein [Actinomycetota bacterium]